jgi:hypothetical protein
VSRIVTAWLVVLILLLFVAPSNEFYRFGPNENLKILGFHVDTPGKYILLLVYSVTSTVIRSLKNNVIQSWITLNIQDESKSLVGLNKLHAYEISLVTEIYGVFLKPHQFSDVQFVDGYSLTLLSPRLLNN